MAVLHGASFTIHLAIELLGIAWQVCDDESLIGTDGVAFELGNNPSTSTPTAGLVVDIQEVLDRWQIHVVIVKPVPAIFQCVYGCLALAQQNLIASLTNDVANIMTFTPAQQQGAVETGIASEYDIDLGPMGPESFDQ